MWSAFSPQGYVILSPPPPRLNGPSDGGCWPLGPRWMSCGGMENPDELLLLLIDSVLGGVRHGCEIARWNHI